MRNFCVTEFLYKPKALFIQFHQIPWNNQQIYLKHHVGASHAYRYYDKTHFNFNIFKRENSFRLSTSLNQVCRNSNHVFYYFFRKQSFFHSIQECLFFFLSASIFSSFQLPTHFLSLTTAAMMLFLLLFWG